LRFNVASEVTLETERLVLRKITKADVSDIQDVYSDREMLLYTNSDIDLNADPFLIDKDMVLEMIESWESDKELLCWGIELKNGKKLIGRVYLYGFIGNSVAGYRADIGYSLSKQYWNHAYTTEAVNRVVSHAFSSLNIIRLQAEILPENIASLKVCEKVGFKKEGILRKYAFYNNNGDCFKDIVMMALTR
jgi:ribosomal-protein-alanine N-acetyltransferase